MGRWRGKVEGGMKQYTFFAIATMQPYFYVENLWQPEVHGALILPLPRHLNQSSVLRVFKVIQSYTERRRSWKRIWCHRKSNSGSRAPKAAHLTNYWLLQLTYFFIIIFSLQFFLHENTCCFNQTIRHRLFIFEYIFSFLLVWRLPLDTGNGTIVIMLKF